MNLEDINSKIYMIKTFFMSLYTCIIYYKIINKRINTYTKMGLLIYVVLISVLCTVIKYESSSFIGILFLILLLSMFNIKVFKSKIGSTIIFFIIAYSINYLLFFLSMISMFFINKIISIYSDYINIICMCLLELIMLYFFTRLKRIKNGVSFISNKFFYTDLFDLMTLNSSIIIIFCSLFFSIRNILASRNIFMCFIIFTFVIIATISKSIQFYYKQKLLINDLEITKNELNNKNEEIHKLEIENIESSKRIHSLIHQQKTLEFKVDKLLQKENNEVSSEVKNSLEFISKDLYSNSNFVELDKTNIREIDDILEYMQYECKKNNIEFNLQLNGNIFQMINNCISKEDLEILIADHIKDAIIAINHSDNINRSILVKLGYFENCFSIYFYDSGIEFSESILDKIGKEPITTYKDEGGSGIGFMNTFDALKKTKASLVIEKIGPPCADNYTKIIIIKFDGKMEFRSIMPNFKVINS